MPTILWSSKIAYYMKIKIFVVFFFMFVVYIGGVLCVCAGNALIRLDQSTSGIPTAKQQWLNLWLFCVDVFYSFFVCIYMCCRNYFNYNMIACVWAFCWIRASCFWTASDVICSCKIEHFNYFYLNHLCFIHDFSWSKNHITKRKMLCICLILSYWTKVAICRTSINAFCAVCQTTNYFTVNTEYTDFVFSNSDKKIGYTLWCVHQKNYEHLVSIAMHLYSWSNITIIFIWRGRVTRKI